MLIIQIILYSHKRYLIKVNYFYTCTNNWVFFTRKKTDSSTQIQCNRPLNCCSVLVSVHWIIQSFLSVSVACLGGAIGRAAVRTAWLRWSESLGSTPGLAGSLCQVIYSGVCFKIKSSVRYRGFDGVLFNLWPLANAGFRDAQYWSLLEPLITDGLLLYAWPVINGSIHMHR